MLPVSFWASVQQKVFQYDPEYPMTHFLSCEGARLYLCYYLVVLDSFFVGLVFRITHSVYTKLLLLSESDLGLLQDLGISYGFRSWSLVIRNSSQICWISGLLDPSLFNIVILQVRLRFLKDYTFCSDQVINLTTIYLFALFYMSLLPLVN